MALRGRRIAVTGFYTWGMLGHQLKFFRVFALWGLTSVWTYVEPSGLSITCARASNTGHTKESTNN
jgi:hypothetical protein